MNKRWIRLTAIVAEREVRQRGRSRAFAVSTIVLLLVVAQLVLPRIAASVVSSRVGRYGKVQSVSVEAWPAVKLLWRLMERQAQVLTFSDCLLLMACVFFAAIFLMPLIHKPRPFTARAH